MSILPVNAVYSGLQTDGFWQGTPTLIIQVMDHPQATTAAPECHDGSYLLPEWDFDPGNEIAFSKLLSIRGSSPYFAYIGSTSLSAHALSFRERHVFLIGRDLGRYDVSPLVRSLIEGGRSVQIGSTVLSPALAIDKAWLSFLVLPTRQPAPATDRTQKPNEVLASIRWRSDLDRLESAYANRRVTVWLKPSQQAETGIYRQCLAVATRHIGWRVVKPIIAR